MRRSCPSGGSLRSCASALTLVACVASAGALAGHGGSENPPAKPTRQQVERARLLTVSHGCGGCHGGVANPAAKGWLAGMMTPDQEFLIGPCGPPAFWASEYTVEKVGPYPLPAFPTENERIPD